MLIEYLMSASRAARGRLLVICGAILLGALSAAFAPAQNPVVESPVSALVDVATLLDDLRTLSADAMEGREFGTPGGAKARAWLVQRFSSLRLRTSEQPVEQRRGSGPIRRGANVIAELRGRSDPSHYIVVSGHYDHVGVQRGRVFNGADDNASGAAALLTIAQYFLAHPSDASLLFVAFDGEESGLIGSRAFVRMPPVSRDAILINLNADMIGRDPDNTLFVVGTARQPALKPFIDRLAARVPVRLRVGHEDPRSVRDDWTQDSDQFAFIEAGIPGLYFGVEDYAQQHQPTDDFETMTQGFYVRAVETLIAAVQEFDAGRSMLAALRR